MSSVEPTKSIYDSIDDYFETAAERFAGWTVSITQGVIDAKTYMIWPEWPKELSCTVSVEKSENDEEIQKVAWTSFPQTLKPRVTLNPQTRDRFLQTSILENIASAQLLVQEKEHRIDAYQLVMGALLKLPKNPQGYVDLTWLPIVKEKIDLIHQKKRSIDSINGKMEFILGNIQKADEILKQCPTRDLYFLGLVKLFIGEIGTANESFQRVLNMDYVRGYLGLGFTSLYCQQPGKVAEFFFKKVQEQVPENYGAFMGLMLAQPLRLPKEVLVVLHRIYVAEQILKGSFFSIFK